MIVLRVVNVILIGESLNSLVINLVSLPIWVNFAHLVVGSCFSFFLVFASLFTDDMSYLFLLSMCLMMFFLLLYWLH